MNDSSPPRTDTTPSSREETMSALFASMVLQQTNMAMLYLGRMPHPETGLPAQDLDAARMFIDQLEMLEFKTRGNLSKDEAALLKQSLSSARMAFVHVVDSVGKENLAPPPTPVAPDVKSEPVASNHPSSEGPSTLAGEERKKFVKKY